MLKKIISTLILCIFLFTACRTNKPAPEQGETSKSNPPAKENMDNSKKTKEGSNPEVAPEKSVPKQESVKKQTVENKVLASFNTEILDSDPNRVNNIRLASKKINGFILKPGETFSFNEVVGKRESKAGYKSAKVLVNGESSEDVGGGICQLSSTIYNSALKLGMEITERHAHSGDVCYVPKGKDAAVSYGYKDLKVKNTKDYSVKFVVSVRNGRVYVSMLKV